MPKVPERKLSYGEIEEAKRKAALPSAAIKRQIIKRKRQYRSPEDIPARNDYGDRMRRLREIGSEEF